MVWKGLQETGNPNSKVQILIWTRMMLQDPPGIYLTSFIAGSFIVFGFYIKSELLPGSLTF